MSSARTRADGDAAQDLSELVERHEEIEWGDIPDIGNAEAAAWTQRLLAAREQLEGEV